MTDRRRGLMGVAKGRLPAGYTEIKYLESSEHQYINTNVVGGFGLDISVISVKNLNAQRALFGSQLASSPWSATFIRYQQGLWVFNDLETGNYVISDLTFPSSISADCFNNRRRLVVDGVVKQDTIIAKTYTNFPIYLFALNSGGNAAQFISAKIDACDMYSDIEHQNKIREFVPCIRNSDDKPGMFDLAGSVCPLSNSPLYINSGSGEFGYETLDGVHVAAV